MWKFRRTPASIERPLAKREFAGARKSTIWWWWDMAAMSARTPSFADKWVSRDRRALGTARYSRDRGGPRDTLKLGKARRLLQRPGSIRTFRQGRFIPDIRI